MGLFSTVLISMALSFSTKVEQVNLMWQEDLSKTAYKQNLNKRKSKAKEWAEELVKWVEYYQENDVKKIGGRLPKDNKAHVVVAAMAVYETHISPSLVGGIGEVGILQIHGKGPLNGYTKKQVRNNPKLGIRLGVRWFAHCYSIAHNKLKSDFKSYGKSVTSYMTGKKMNFVITPARKRILLAEEYYLMYLFGFENF